MAKEVASAAFTSSMVNFFNSESAKELFSSNKRSMEEFITFYSQENEQLLPTLHNLSYNLQLFDFPNKLIDSLKDIKGLKLNYKETLQNKLTYFLQEKRIEEMDKVKDNPQYDWWKLHRNDNSGKWLEVFPKIEFYTFSSLQFRTNLRYRMRFPHPHHMPGSVCDCVYKTPLDSFGIHLTGGCPQHGDRHNIHNTIVHELNALCHYAGLHTQHEPPNLFSSIEENKREKPDIAILNPQNLQEQDNVQKLLIDVSLPCPIAGSRYCEFEVPPSQIKAQIQHNRAKTCFNDKMTKYSKLFEDYKVNQLASNNLSACDKDIPEFGIVPFIVDLVGFIHPVSLKFLRSIADRAKGIYNVGFKGMFIYFQRRISCALAKTMSNNLIARVSSINSQKSYKELDAIVFEEPRMGF
jgi:hypothetical protein